MLLTHAIIIVDCRKGLYLEFSVRECNGRTGIWGTEVPRRVQGQSRGGSLGASAQKLSGIGTMKYRAYKK